MKTIKVFFCDFYDGFQMEDNDFINTLRKHYHVVITPQPDVLFYSVFGKKHLQYDCIRIFYTGEMQSPDFNVCDYAIGFDYLQYRDRYLRYPLYKFEDYRSRFLCRRQTADDGCFNRKFCSFVCSNDSGMGERKSIFERLSAYKEVASGGRYLNNIGYAVSDKLDFISLYKFNIAVENSSFVGYTTEKILEAFSAKTIPIYFGNPEIVKEFNPRAFINCHDYSNFDEVLAKVQEIDNDRDAYVAMLNEEPVVSDNDISGNDLERFLVHIFDQDISQAQRRPRNARTREIESEKKLIYHLRHVYKLIKKCKSFVRRFRNSALKYIKH